jgi:hypothetical protein
MERLRNGSCRQLASLRVASSPTVWHLKRGLTRTQVPRCIRGHRYATREGRVGAWRPVLVTFMTADRTCTCRFLAAVGRVVNCEQAHRGVAVAPLRRTPCALVPDVLDPVAGDCGVTLPG